MSNYIYKCFNCETEFSSKKIESELIYICPRCGECKKNSPLKGVLKIVYDYNEIKSQISREKFLKLNSGRLLEYPFLIPLDFSKLSQSRMGINNSRKLELTAHPVTEFRIDFNNILVFDDSRNLTLSYKDRASILIALKAIEMGIKEISAASTGNAGSSLAGICALLGMSSKIFVPKNIPPSKRIQIQSYGANLYCIDGDYDEAFDLCLEISSKKKWYNRNTGYNPLTIEGKKTSVFDMFIQLQGELPDEIYISAGDGVIVSGIFKGIEELYQLGWIEKFPQLNIVQADGSDAIISYLETKNFIYKPANTIADSICAGVPRNLYMAVKSVELTEGKGIRVSDEEILSAQKTLAEYGFLTEPAAAAAYAGYLKNLDNLKDNKKSMIMLTGNGLKDLSSLQIWNDDPLPKSYETLIRDLIDSH